MEFEERTAVKSQLRTNTSKKRIAGLQFGIL